MSAPLWTTDAMAAAMGAQACGALPKSTEGLSIDTRSLQCGDHAGNDLTVCNGIQHLPLPRRDCLERCIISTTCHPSPKQSQATRTRERRTDFAVQLIPIFVAHRATRLAELGERLT